MIALRHQTVTTISHNKIFFMTLKILSISPMTCSTVMSGSLRLLNMGLIVILIKERPNDLEHILAFNES